MRIAIIIAAGLAAALGLAGCASHPAHPAFYVGYSGTHWDRDFDVQSGRCDYPSIEAAIAGSGGLDAAPAGTRRPVGAMLVGDRIDTLLSRKIDRELDPGDRVCLGYALELGRSGKRVRWVNADSGVRYQVIPYEGHVEIAGDCREFKLIARTSERKSKRRGTACQKGPGLWQMSRL
jgi:surface antigen